MTVTVRFDPPVVLEPGWQLVAFTDPRKDPAMGRYRKLPVEIDAVQLTVENAAAVLEFMQETSCPFEVVGEPGVNPYMVIHTLEGDMNALHGDWLIRGVKGEFYPCQPDIFEATYEAVEEFVGPTTARTRDFCDRVRGAVFTAKEAAEITAFLSTRVRPG